MKNKKCEKCEHLERLKDEQFCQFCIEGSLFVPRAFFAFRFLKLKK